MCPTWSQLRDILALALDPWPLALIICVFILRNPLEGLLAEAGKWLKRMRHAKVTWSTASVEAGWSQQDTQTELKPPLPEPGDAQATPYLANFEYKQATDKLWASGREYAQAMAQEVRTSTLERDRLLSYVFDFLAIMRVELEFERFYRLALGSQLKALEKLNTVAAMPDTVMFSVYQDAVENWPDNLGDFPYDQWKHYLKTHRMVVEVYSGSELHIEITQRGKDFLAYVVRSGISLEKGL